MNIDLVDLLLRLLHIIPAIFLAGGVFFMWSSLLPGVSGVADDARTEVLAAVRSKWSKIVMATSGLLLVTGLINLGRNAMGYDYVGGPLYHILGTVKLLLGLVIMFLAARLSGKSAGAQKFRERETHWIMITTVLLFVVILLASTMRSMDKTPKVKEEATAATSVSLLHEEA